MSKYVMGEERHPLLSRGIEVLSYIVVGAIALVCILVYSSYYQRPNTTLGQGRSSNFLVDLIMYILELLSKLFHFEANDSSGTASPANNSPSLLRGLFLLIFGGIIVIIVVKVAILLSKSSWLRNRQIKTNKLSQSEKVTKLLFSRNEALIILEESLITELYSDAIIRAYHSLDYALASFREGLRPPHLTAKEFAYSVHPPVFQPSVAKIVEHFYFVRYAMQKAPREYVESFIHHLHLLFFDEVSSELKEKMVEEFKKLNPRMIVAIPMYGDLSKPGKIDRRRI